MTNKQFAELATGCSGMLELLAKQAKDIDPGTEMEFMARAAPETIQVLLQVVQAINDSVVAQRKA